MVKKAKKRGVKSGTKRGPYRRNKVIKGLQEAIKFKLTNKQWSDLNTPQSVGNLPSLMTELQSAISQLEGQLTAQIDRIKSILV